MKPGCPCRVVRARDDGDHWNDDLRHDDGHQWRRVAGHRFGHQLHHSSRPAWGLSLPTLYVMNSLSGSRLSASTTFLAALVTTSWGGLAMIASIPINWFFSVAVPNPTFILLVNLAVFTGVGVAMTDIFGRVMQTVKPSRGRRPVAWLFLVAAIGGELVLPA